MKRKSASLLVGIALIFEARYALMGHLGELFHLPGAYVPP